MTGKLLDPRAVGLALALALMLGVVPAGVEAKPVASMASDATALSARQAREAEVGKLLAEQRVAKALDAVGLTPEQVRSRLDQLSDEQLEQLAQNLETIQAGKGTAILLGLLAVILLGVLVYMQIEAS